jgi:hypothetical protein
MNGDSQVSQNTKEKGPRSKHPEKSRELARSEKSPSRFERAKQEPERFEIKKRIGGAENL